MLHLPNLLTASRISLVPLLFFALSLDGAKGIAAAFLVVVLAELTDLLDGHFARSLNQQSEFGAQFDPLADSLYRIGAFTALAAHGQIPVWTVMLFAWRDVLVCYARLMMQSKGRAVGARLSGKLKAIVQGIAIISLMAAPLVPANIVEPYLARGFALSSFWLAATITVWSGIDYLLAGLQPSVDRS